jgi:BirA family biotin operon repressor/biotin-[acetyl-CoA-carboxylase] ligase
VLAAVLDALERRVGGRPDDVLDAWRERDVLLGSGVRWNGGEGTAAGLDADGSLLVDTADGRIALDAGEVHLQR